MTGNSGTDDQCRYFQEPLAAQLEAKRGEARKKRRITYDCFNAVVMEGRVSCARRRFPSSIPIVTVLRGRSAAVCVKCLDYDDGGETNG